MKRIEGSSWTTVMPLKRLLSNLLVNRLTFKVNCSKLERVNTIHESGFLDVFAFFSVNKSLVFLTRNRTTTCMAPSMVSVGKTKKNPVCLFFLTPNPGSV